MMSFHVSHDKLSMELNEGVYCVWILTEHYAVRFIHVCQTSIGHSALVSKDEFFGIPLRAGIYYGLIRFYCRHLWQENHSRRMNILHSFSFTWLGRWKSVMSKARLKPVLRDKSFRKSYRFIAHRNYNEIISDEI